MRIGCDIVENKRLIGKSTRFIDLVLTPKEQDEYQKYGLNYLCGRFAAKEAIMKCLNNTKDISFLDIEILNKEDGQPYCTNIDNISLSISHEKKYTIAMAIIY